MEKDKSQSSREPKGHARILYGRALSLSLSRFESTSRQRLGNTLDSAEEDVGVGVVERVEKLRLHRIEVRKFVDLLVPRVAQSGDGQRVQRQQVRVGRVAAVPIENSKLVFESG